MRIERFVAMEIPTVTHNALMPVRGKGGRLAIAKKPELEAAEQVWESRLASALLPMERPLEGAIRAEVRFAFCADGRHLPGEPHTEKPDLDNLEKTLWDALQRIGAIVDDCAICDKRVTKMWAEVPGVYLALEEVERNDDE